MNAAYHAEMATRGQALVTHIGLFSSSGVELAGGGYARRPVSWVRTGGSLRMAADLVFTTEAGDTVSEWRGFNALTGGTDYGGKTVATRTWTNPGTYTLSAASTGIDHQAGA